MKAPEVELTIQDFRDEIDQLMMDFAIYVQCIRAAEDLEYNTQCPGCMGPCDQCPNMKPKATTRELLEQFKANNK